VKWSGIASWALQRHVKVMLFGPGAFFGEEEWMACFISIGVNIYHGIWGHSEVLKCLAENGLAISQDKCFWSTTQVDFLGYVISKDGIEIAQDKVQCIQDWECPRCLRDIQSFIGFANFYQWFIEGFSKITKPLSDSTKGSPKDWI
jgi:hypothetical protein